MKKYLFLFISAFLWTSCARVGSPVGGSKDSLAPVVIGSNIDSSRVNVARNIKQLRIDFDEYITLKEIQKNLIISPPIKYKRILPTTLGNKYVSIEWEEELLENTTYNFNFGNAIVDLNEGNVLPYYNFAFSTGAEIDKTYISGEVFNGVFKPKENNVKKNGFVVGLYKAADSINYSQKPYYIAKADDDGYFELNFLSPGKYRLIAFDDTDGNSIFTPGKDDVYFENEDLDLKESISGKKIKVYPSKKPVRLLENKEITGGMLFTFEGKPENVEFVSQSEKLKEYKVDHRKYSDSVIVWFDDTQLELPETNINEQLKFSYVADSIKGNTSHYYKKNGKQEFVLTNSSGSDIPPIGKLTIDSPFPITEIQPEKWSLKVDSLNVQPFKANINPNNPYKLEIVSDFINGKKYELTIPKETLGSYFKQLPKSHLFNFTADKVQNYGNLTVKLKSRPTTKFWAQLLSESDEVKYSQLVDSSDFSFNTIKPGRYYVRLLVDNNGNGIWDEADFAKGLMAEEVYVFNKIIEIRAMWDNIEDQWDPLKVEEDKVEAIKMNDEDNN